MLLETLCCGIIHFSLPRGMLSFRKEVKLYWGTSSKMTLMELLRIGDCARWKLWTIWFLMWLQSHTWIIHNSTNHEEKRQFVNLLPHSLQSIVIFLSNLYELCSNVRILEIAVLLKCLVWGGGHYGPRGSKIVGIQNVEKKTRAHST